jgi:hypothetical protein
MPELERRMGLLYIVFHRRSVGPGSSGIEGKRNRAVDLLDHFDDGVDQ